MCPKQRAAPLALPERSPEQLCTELLGERNEGHEIPLGFNFQESMKTFGG